MQGPSRHLKSWAPNRAPQALLTLPMMPPPTPFPGPSVTAIKQHRPCFLVQQHQQRNRFTTRKCTGTCSQGHIYSAGL